MLRDFRPDAQSRPSSQPLLDMAAAVRGISSPGEEEQAALRFADQSHLNREFRHFIGMTPGQFEKAPTPLLNAILKLREDGLG